MCLAALSSQTTLYRRYLGVDRSLELGILHWPEFLLTFSSFPILVLSVMSFSCRERLT